MRGARPAAPVVAPPPPMGPDAAHFAAQDALTAAGKKLADQEKWKRAEHPFDAYGRLKAQARAGAFPKPDDNFRWRYFGLFYVAPTQSSYMMRLRIPNGILSHAQFAGLADLAERYAGGYAHVTTRANIQMREIAPADATAIVEAVQDLGLCSRGSGADNIRNVTGGATAGIDPQELTDTRPLAREWHFHILNDRSLTGLPRKFNVAFDGGGRDRRRWRRPTTSVSRRSRSARAPASSRACGSASSSAGSPATATWRATSASSAEPEECTAIADAIVRVFIDSGDRTDRAKARLKYVLDGWGVEKFLAAVEAKLGRPLTRVVATAIAARPPVDRAAHIGVHPQAQAGLNWIGVALPVGRMTADQMRGVAAIARDFGDGDLRLTVWQNLLVSGVADDKVEAAKARDRGARPRLARQCAPGRSGRLHRRDRLQVRRRAHQGARDHCAEHLPKRGLALDPPINIHLTGCHHSCAQHYIGDIGLMAVQGRRRRGRRADRGLHDRRGRRLRRARAHRPRAVARRSVRAAPARSRACCAPISAHRSSAEESFHAFADRHEPECSKPSRRRNDRAGPAAAPADPAGRAVLAGAAGVAQRVLRRGPVARRRAGAVERRITPRSRRRRAGRRTRRQRFRAVARPVAADRRAHGDGGGPAAGAAHDGGDGAAGLRPVRLQLRGLRQRAGPQERGAADAVRAGRQRDGAHAQAARRRDRRRASPRRRS